MFLIINSVFFYLKYPVSICSRTHQFYDVCNLCLYLQKSDLQTLFTEAFSEAICIVFVFTSVTFFPW